MSTQAQLPVLRMTRGSGLSIAPQSCLLEAEVLIEECFRTPRHVVSHGSQWKMKSEYCGDEVTNTQAEAIRRAKAHIAALGGPRKEPGPVRRGVRCGCASRTKQ
jgi:hypothetical protein